jgi:transportin-3
MLLPSGRLHRLQLRFKKSAVGVLIVFIFPIIQLPVLDGLENLEVMLHVIQGYGEQLPATCQNTCEEAWAIFDAFILKYGNNFDLAERTTRVLRRGLDLFGKALLPIAPSIITRMSFAFEATGFPGFLWIAGKVIGRFGYDEDPNWRGAVREIFERSTAKVVAMLQVKSPRELPDGWWSLKFSQEWNLILLLFSY